MRSDLQRAVYEFLVPVLGVPVFDDVPQHTQFPYVVIGEDSLTPDDTDDSRGAEASIDIHLWSDYAGRAEVKRIADEIYAALHQTLMTVPGYGLAVALWESSDSFDESDGTTRHGVETYRVLLQE